MKIYIVRHAYAGESGDPRWSDDALRPLTAKGAKRFRRVARRLAELGVAPTAIATSPLVRCGQTAEILQQALPDAPPLVELTALAPGSRLADLLAWTEEQGGDVAWVGHAPDVSELTAALIGAGAALRFAKGACAAVEISPPLAPGHGELRWLAPPKLLE